MGRTDLSDAALSSLGPEIVKIVGVNVEQNQCTTGPFSVLCRVNCHLELVECCIRNGQELSPRARSWYRHSSSILGNVHAAGVRELKEYFDLVNLFIPYHVLVAAKEKQRLTNRSTISFRWPSLKL